MGDNPVRRARVLLADDNRPVLDRVLSVLRPDFEVVGIAENGQQLVREAKRLVPDVIVVDIMMPELTGIEAAHTLKEAGSTAKIVFLTVHEEAEFVQACFAEGGSGYVTKSRLRTDLVSAINEALLGHRFVSPTVPR
jgi:DNA-binding NarL/FixJ family response regulator